MNNIIWRNIIRFVLIYIFQVFVLKRMSAGWAGDYYLNVIIYPLFLMMLPLRTPRTLLLVIGFLAGILIDIFYESYGIHNALLIDNTGVWRDRDGLGRHLKAKGIDKVMFTAPAKGDIPNIVYGVNHEKYDPKLNTIFSAASCTTNAIVPTLSVIESNLGIEKGHIETIHSYTNDQNLLDNYHKKPRRGRAAPLNMVITSTGAGAAAAKVIPSLAGKITANAVRVPTANVSLAILSLTLKKTTTREDIIELLRHAALRGDFVEQIRFSASNESVSSDFIGDPVASIFDSPATLVSEDGKNVQLYLWYDNEFGYTMQVIRLSRYFAKVKRYTYY